MKFDEFLREHRIHFETEGIYAREGWIQFQCPFCRGGKDPNKPYMGFNTVGTHVNCWRCGPHRLGETIAALARIPISTAIQIAGTIDKVRLKSEQRVLERKRLKLPSGLGKLDTAHKKYLRKRNYKPATLVRLWEIGGIRFGGRLSWRIFIPIKMDGCVVSWTTRSLVDTGARYLSAGADEEAYPHKSLLYGEEYCRHSVVVVEGPFDVWRIGPGAVGTCGTGFSPAQILRISKYPQRSICFDNEPEAQKRARKLCDQLEAFPGETNNIILSGKDASDTSLKDIKKIREAYLGL